jgi:hypothetical protein
VQVGLVDRRGGGAPVDGIVQPPRRAPPDDGLERARQERADERPEADPRRTQIACERGRGVEADERAEGGDDQREEQAARASLPE